MGQKSKVIAGLSIIVVIFGTLVGVSVADDRRQQSNDTSSQPATSSEQTIKSISYKGEEGKNALELLKASYTIETKHYESLGDLVTGINGVRPNSQQFWAFYVNGQQSQVGAGDYMTKPSDIIVWKLEAIQ